MTKTHAHLQKENQVNISTVHWKIVFSLLHIFQEIELREEREGVNSQQKCTRVLQLIFHGCF